MSRNGQTRRKERLSYAVFLHELERIERGEEGSFRSTLGSAMPAGMSELAAKYQEAVMGPKPEWACRAARKAGKSAMSATAILSLELR